MQQAKEYAEILGLKFAYASNGREIIEFDFLTGIEQKVDRYPTPDELWQRQSAGTPIATSAAAKTMLQSLNHSTGKPPRYYQEIAINRTVQAILSGQKRILLTMATGTGNRHRLGALRGGLQYRRAPESPGNSQRVRCAK